MFLPRHTGPTAQQPEGPRGWGYIRRHREVLDLLLLTASVVLVFGIFEVGLPTFVVSRLPGGSITLGVMWTAFGLGAMIGAMAPGVHRNRSIWSAAAMTATMVGGALVMVGVTTFLPICLLAILCLGLAYGPYSTIASSYLQSVVAGDRLAGVMAMWTGRHLGGRPYRFLLLVGSWSTRDHRSDHDPGGRYQPGRRRPTGQTRPRRSASR